MAKHQVLVGVVLAGPVALLTSAWIAGFAAFIWVAVSGAVVANQYGKTDWSCRLQDVWAASGDERRSAPVHLCLLGVLPVGHHRATVPRRLCRQFARLLIRRGMYAHASSN